MIELLNSNFQPLKTSDKTFESKFYELFSKSEEVNIASGYISEDSITQLIGIYDNGFPGKINLIVGMHYFDGFTQLQYQALKKLSNNLLQKSLGVVKLSTVSPYHGKIYSFKTKEKILSAIIGSSNLTKIHTPERIYDTDLYIDEVDINIKIEKFLSELSVRYCTDINSIDFSKIKIINRKELFSDHTEVEHVNFPSAEIEQILTPIKFTIPLKTEPKSGLNAFHGKGRLNTSNGMVIPRDWYEVELIISNKITNNVNYPKKDHVFYVITDDGYKFKCKTSGDYSKNFRSAVDLKVLGRWIKGRLENSGALYLGEQITEQTFTSYGRSDISLVKTKLDNTWYLDFGVRQ
jgi:hypothetical protein